MSSPIASHAVPNTIPPAVVRRVNRVRARIEPHAEEPEVVLDDIFVLCRAFEHTWDDLGGERREAEDAVVQTVAAHGIAALPGVRAFVTALSAFVPAPAGELVEWFGSDQRAASDVKREVVSAVRTLQEAARSDAWTEYDSRKLGKLIYRMRCAVVHPSLDTQNSLAGPLLPRLRAALIDLTIARSATRYGVPLAEAQRQFDAAL